MTVAIIDYGSGNLHSAAKAFERASRASENPEKISVTHDPDAVYRADRIVLPISSQPNPTLETEVPIQNWKRAGLTGPSFVKPAPATTARDLIERKLGHLGDADLQAVRELLRKILVLDD